MCIYIYIYISCTYHNTACLFEKGVISHPTWGSPVKLSSRLRVGFGSPFAVSPLASLLLLDGLEG